MSWGTELWDQYDTLSHHTQKGIDFMDKFSHFIKDRCSIEIDYASKLRKLVKSYQPRKKSDDDDNCFSTHVAFQKMNNEINDLAGQHEVIAETLQLQVVKELAALIKEIRDERKKHFSEGTKLNQSYASQVQQLDRSKKNYEKTYRDSEKAVEQFQRADKDMQMSKAEVEKQRVNMQIKAHYCELAKKEYADQLQRTNDLKRSHFKHLMPEVFSRVQELEENRIKGLRSLFYKMANVEKAVIPIIVQCLDGIVKAADGINEKEDSLQVIEKNQSGFQPPPDFEFVDLSRQCLSGSIGSGSSGGGGSGLASELHNGSSTSPPQSALNQSTGSNRLSETLSNAANTLKGTVMLGKNKKRAGLFSLFGSSGGHGGGGGGIGGANGSNGIGKNGLFDGKEDFASLPPNQQKKRIRARINDIQKAIDKQISSREGLLKLKNAFEDFPNYGDPSSVEIQLVEGNKTLTKLQNDLKRFEDLLANYQNGNSNQVIVKQQPQQQIQEPHYQNNDTVDHKQQSQQQQHGTETEECFSRSESSDNTSTSSLSHRVQAVALAGSTFSPAISSNNLTSTTTSTVAAAGTTQVPVVVTESSSQSTDNVLTQRTYEVSNSPESGLGTSHTSIPNMDDSDADHSDGPVAKTTTSNNMNNNNQDPILDENNHLYSNEEFFYDGELLPPLGVCKALYSFQATSEGSIPIDQNEELYLIELDQGDGWTRVRRFGDETIVDEGFVPTTYIEIRLYNGAIE